MKEICSWSVFRFTSHGRIRSRVLAINLDYVIVIDPSTGDVKSVQTLDSVKKVSWDRRTKNLFRIVFINDDVHVYLSDERLEIVEVLIWILQHRRDDSDHALIASDRWKTLGVGSFMVQGIDAKGKLHSHTLVLGPTTIQHVNRDDDALFAQHSFEDVDSFRFSEKDRLKIALKYKNDNPYVFIVSAKDRHKLMCLLGGRIHLFQGIVQKLAIHALQIGEREVDMEDVDSASKESVGFSGTRIHEEPATPAPMAAFPAGGRQTSRDSGAYESSQNVMHRPPPHENTDIEVRAAHSEEIIVDDKILGRLAQPQVLMKHIRTSKNAKPHSRYFQMDRYGHLRWGKNAKSMGPEREIVGLESGEKALKRFRGITDDEIRRSFKFVLDNGDQIPVIAPSDEVLDDWIKGVGFVLQKRVHQ